jgi:hypothetical protein
MRSLIAALLFVPALCLALPANAQLGGTPGTGPLVPGGPRQGLGPPSLRDNVPDIRLHSSEGGIPGAGPPIDYRGGYGGTPGNAGLGGGYRFIDRPTVRAAGLRCRTLARVCVLRGSAPVGTGCSCRTANGGRARGAVIR